MAEAFQAFMFSKMYRKTTKLLFKAVNPNVLSEPKWLPEFWSRWSQLPHLSGAEAHKQREQKGLVEIKFQMVCEHI